MGTDPSLERPRLRPVEAFSAADGRVGLRDPQGFSDKLLLLPPELFFIVSLFDGEHSLLDIQAEYARQFGGLLFSDQLRKIVGQLDEALLLASQRFEGARAEAEREFAASPVRAASHAGLSYEREPEALRRMLDGLLSTAAIQSAPPPGHLRALIAPHIDLRRGGACYAAAYSGLALSGRTFVILGVSHVETGRRYALTAKDFQTPLGTVTADREFIQALRACCRTDFFQDELAHRSEHSVEFQVLFLRHLQDRLGGEVRIVPVLCTSLPQLASGEPPEGNEEAEEFISALGSVLRERGAESVLIAGADLSHVGRRFGQELALGPALLQELERADRNMIEGILRGDAAGFFRGIQLEKDRRNVCGVPAIYTLLRLLPPGVQGRLLHYAQAPDAASGSVVTFMSAAFSEPGR